jgi:hypothetical protein
MFLSIYNNRTGEEHLRRLAPRESLDLREHVRKWAADYDSRPSFSEPGSHIPNGCGEYQAELRETKAAGAVCWTSEPFYLEPDE